jgi:hypothetical protein
MKRYLSLIFLLGVLAGSMHLSADAAVTITVRPAVALANSTAQIRVLVAPNAKNRQLEWEVDGPTYYRKSSRELGGESAPRTFLFLVRDLPQGSFEVRATVKRNDNSSAIDRSHIMVVGGRE